MRGFPWFPLWLVWVAMLTGSCCSELKSQPRFSILGDSYSTFGGYVTPSTNLCWYNGTDGGNGPQQNDVRRVEDTWWFLLAQKYGLRLDTNNSYSGSTVCHTGYEGVDYSDRSFVTRLDELGRPDILLVFGGTNDSWAGVPIGEYRYDAWSRQDLYAFRPAFSYLLHHLKERYPQTRILVVTNTELSEAVTASMDSISRHYGIDNVRLHDIDKQAGHPSVAGMKAICEQVGDRLNRIDFDKNR